MTRKLDRALLIFATVALVIAVLYPALRLLLEALFNWRADALDARDGWPAIWNTLVIGIGTVLISGVIGTALAFLLSLYDFPGRNVLAAAAFLPFTLPPLVGTLSFWYLMGSDGFVAIAAREWFGLDDFYPSGMTAVLIIHGYSFYVFFYAMVSAALTNLDASLAEAARTLGASKARVFSRVTLPLLWPSIMGASLLTFMSSGASFSAPYFFGEGQFDVLSTLIYRDRWSGPDGLEKAKTLTLVLAVVSMLGVIVFRSSGTGTGQGSKGVRRTISSTGGRVAASVIAWATVALLIVPHAVIVLFAFVDHATWHEQAVPSDWTFAHFTQLFTESDTYRPIVQSLWMSTVATLAVVLVALPAAYLIGRQRQYSTMLNLLIMLPWALPGTVVAINIIVAFNDPAFPRWTAVWLLPLAYFVRTVPLFARMATAAIQTFDASLMEAGRTLGASPLYCFMRIAMPLLAPAVAAAAALAFATSLGEYVASALLYMPAKEPIAVKIGSLLRGDQGPAFAYSVLLMLMVAATFVMARRFASRPL